MHRKGEGLFRLLVLLAGLLTAAAVILLCSDEPLAAMRYFLVGPFSSAYFFGDMLAAAVPLMLTGLAASVAFSASVWNLGLEGMAYFGMLAGTGAAYLLRDWPGAIAVPLFFAASALGGAALSAVCVLLKKRFGVETMISSLLVANIAFYAVMLAVEGPFRDASSGLGVTSYAVPAQFAFAKLLPPSDLNGSLFFALLLAVLTALLLRRTRLGCAIRMTGKNPVFARYGGVDAAGVAAAATLLSGGLAGMGGMTYVMNTSLRVHNRLPGVGWSGISVAMIAGEHPLLVVPVALFFAYLEKGAECAALFADVTPDMAQIIQGAILLLATAEKLIPRTGAAAKGKRRARR